MYDLPPLRAQALTLITMDQGRQFGEVEIELRTYLLGIGHRLPEDLCMAGYAIGSLIYDGFVTVYANGELYPVNYPVSRLPARHRLQYLTHDGAHSDDLIEQLAWVDSRG